jgi:YVTN family beta-propeller protein
LVPFGVSVSPDGSRAYVANQNSNNVSVINTTTNTVVATVAVGTQPVGFGKSIGPAPAPAPVPTLSEWAMILFGLILAGGAAVLVQRRRMTI